MIDHGPLAAALAKAQSSFPPITRDKTVTVQTKTGGSYSFSYAPLDRILDAVREPLSSNGLALVQLLDDDDLVTMLLHESGASVQGRTPIPATTDVQAFGSAITYLRRYAIQALLGIAAEEDDDGNRAAGNRVSRAKNKAESESESEKPTDPAGETVTPLGPATREGAVVKGQGRHSDLEWRQTPDGYHIGFLLEVGDNKARPQVVIEGPLADALFAAMGSESIEGQKVTVTGDVFEVRAPNRRVIYRIHATSIATADFMIPSPDVEASETLPWDADVLMRVE